MNKQNSSKNFKKIKDVLEFAWNNQYSQFYKDKYKKSGISSIKHIKSFDDFGKLPFLTRDEIVKAGPFKFFFLSDKFVESVIFSSGTTRNYPLISFVSSLPRSYVKTRFKKHLELKIKSLMMLYAVFPGQMRIRTQKYLWENGVKLLLGDVNNPSLTTKIALNLKVDAIQSTPTILYYFIPYLEKELDLSKIKLIMIGGEFCSEQKFAYLKSKFKNAYFEMTYGGAETRGKGYRCDRLSKLSPRFFHPYSAKYYFETIGSKGQDELVITSLLKDGTPLIRYKTGDAVKLITEKCECGQTQIMEVFGRLEYDAVKISGVVIYSKIISDALSPLSKYLASLDWKMHVYENVRKDKIQTLLKLQLIAKSVYKNNESIKLLLQKEVSANLYLSGKITLSDLVNKGAFLPLEIEFVDTFPPEYKRKNIISHVT